jgi:hypothetical protein
VKICPVATTYGLVVESEDDGHPAKALLRVMRDPLVTERLGAAAHQRCERGYLLEHMNDQNVRAFRVLLDHGETS